jgi:hypothetical protein
VDAVVRLTTELTSANGRQHGPGWFPVEHEFQTLGDDIVQGLKNSTPKMKKKKQQRLKSVNKHGPQAYGN